MLFYPFYDPTYIIIIPALILALYAQAKVSSTYAKYSKIGNSRNITGAQAARMILDRNGLSDVAIERIPGNLTDHFDPRAKVIRLSDSVYNNTSVAAVGVAAHEAGHAVQHDTAYMPIKVRNAILPVAQLSSQLAVPLIILGLIMSGFSFLINTGIILFSAAVLFQLITLPVEFNASRRAISTVYESGFLNEVETEGARKVLNAAALTYIAAALTSLLQLLRFILIAGGGRRRD